MTQVSTYRAPGVRFSQEEAFRIEKVTETRKQILDALAKRESMMLDTPQHRLFDPFRMGSGSVADRYYENLCALVDGGFVFTKGKELNPTYHLTAKGWTEVGGAPFWMEVA